MKELSGRPKLSPLLARIDLRVLVYVCLRVCVCICAKVVAAPQLQTVILFP